MGVRAADQPVEDQGARKNGSSRADVRLHRGSGPCLGGGRKNEWNIHRPCQLGDRQMVSVGCSQIQNIQKAEKILRQKIFVQCLAEHLRLDRRQCELLAQPLCTGVNLPTWHARRSLISWAVVPQDFDEITAAAAEDVEIASVRVTLEALLNPQSQALHATAHVGMPGCDPNPARGNGYHRRPRTSSTRRNAVASTSLPTITRWPPDRTITIRPPLGRVAGSPAGEDCISATADARGQSAAITAGTNPGSSSAARLSSRACRRQANSWLVESPCRRAVADTTRGALKLSATIRYFFSSVHRRRAPVSITSSVETFDIGV